MAAISGGTAIAMASLAGGLGAGAHRAQQNQQQRAADKVGRTVAAGNAENERRARSLLMPTPDQNNIQRSRLNSLRSLQERSGRASTLLSNPANQNNTFG